MPGHSISAQRLSALHPVLKARATAFLALCHQSGLSVIVTQGLRTWEEQDALYAKGRTAPPIGQKHRATMAKGGQSFHNFGLAFDFVVLDAWARRNGTPHTLGGAQPESGPKPRAFPSGSGRLVATGNLTIKEGLQISRT